MTTLLILALTWALLSIIVDSGIIEAMAPSHPSPPVESYFMTLRALNLLKNGSMAFFLFFLCKALGQIGVALHASGLIQ